MGVGGFGLFADYWDDILNILTCGCFYSVGYYELPPLSVSYW